MGEASYPSFFGGTWSGAQLMKQKIWTTLFRKSNNKILILLEKMKATSLGKKAT